MIKHKFYLRKDVKAKDGFCPVFLDITFQGKRLRIPVPSVKAKEAHWSTKDQRIKRPLKNEACNFCDEYNLILGQHETAIEDIKRVILITGGRISKQFILDRLRNPSKLKVDRKDFFAIYDEYLGSMRVIRAKNTIKGIVTCFNFLQLFCKETNTSINFDELNARWFEAFRKYAFEEKRIGDNYFFKIIGCLKTFCQWAHDHDYHSNLGFKKFRAPERATEVIYLTMDELMTLYKFDFKSRRLSHVRDFYCFACFTGLRFSDMIKLKPHHIKGDYIIKTIEKTQEMDVRIPLSSLAKDVLKKYQDTAHEPLPKISGQKFNDYIKECCKVTGIVTPVSRVRFFGSQRKETVHPKWQLITSHTARKTFVTNSLILGMKEMVIRNITGHKKEENFKKYVKIADNVKKQEIENAWNNSQLLAMG